MPEAGAWHVENNDVSECAIGIIEKKMNGTAQRANGGCLHGRPAAWEAGRFPCKWQDRVEGIDVRGEVTAIHASELVETPDGAMQTSSVHGEEDRV